MNCYSRVPCLELACSEMQTGLQEADVNGELGVRCMCDPQINMTALMLEFLLSVIEIKFPSFVVGFMK